MRPKSRYLSVVLVALRRRILMPSFSASRRRSSRCSGVNFTRSTRIVSCVNAPISRLPHEPLDAPHATRLIPDDTTDEVAARVDEQHLTLLFDGGEITQP